jgi:hypothetical protein
MAAAASPKSHNGRRLVTLGEGASCLSVTVAVCGAANVAAGGGAGIPAGEAIESVGIIVPQVAQNFSPERPGAAHEGQTAVLLVDDSALMMGPSDPGADVPSSVDVNRP